MYLGRAHFIDPGQLPFSLDKTIDKFIFSKHTLILSWKLIPNPTTIVSDQRFTRTH
jgi:hypothetical protein